MRQRHGTARRLCLTAAGLALATTLAACGSQLQPDEVVQATGAGGGASGGGTGDAFGAAPTSDGLGGAVVGDVPAAGNVPAIGGGGGVDDPGPATGAAGGGNANDEAPENEADGGVDGGSCDGLENQTGITDSTITLANASDISGPVPGLFESAQLGAQAYVAYFNSTSDICGRKLELLTLDSRSDAAGDQAAYTRACAEAFAAVGSESIFDSGGAGTTQSCGLPDIRSGALTAERTGCSTCFGTQAAQVGVVTDAFYRFFRQQDQAATDKAAFLFLNVGGSPDLAKSYSEVAASVGFGVELLQGIDASEFNYAPYVQQLKDKGVQYVSFVGANIHAVRMAQAMEQQGFEPKYYVVTQTQYNNAYVETGGAAVEGTYLPLPHPLFDSSGSSELKLYRSWLQQVRPGAEPTTFGLFSWSATRLFVEKSIGLGGRLSRETLLDAVRRERKWDANGLHTPMDVGGKQTYKCIDMVQLQDGVWRKVSGNDYLCGSLVTTSVAG